MRMHFKKYLKKYGCTVLVFVTLIGTVAIAATVKSDNDDSGGAEDSTVEAMAVESQFD